MEVRLRLQRIKPAKHRYHFRIVAIKRQTGRDAGHLDILGYYDPSRRPMMLNVDHAKIDKWIGQGASMSDTVASLVRRSKRAKTSDN